MILVSMFLFIGDTPMGDVTILYPLQSDSVSYDPGKILIVSAVKDTTASLVFSTQWAKEKVFDLSVEGAKANFAKDFYKLFEPKTSIGLITYSFKYFKGYAKAESLSFAYPDSVDIKKLWQRPEFAKFVKDVQQKPGISDVFVTLTGWFDSVYTTPYDDPMTDGRLLYKVQVRLLPGANTIYCSYPGKRSQAVAYSATMVMETKANADRENHFHFSALEQSCATCHEGLPSSDDGASMKADCNVCHKSMSSGAVYLHAPAEMQECTGCHGWSAEKKVVVVEKGVPGACFDCHGEKQTQVDNAKFPHPVAGECLTCHSAHGTDQKHIVKEDIYTLCISCHEGKKVNHPVGRHPLRFAKLSETEEISCVSCHNPHGSEFETLLRGPGGPMASCEACH